MFLLHSKEHNSFIFYHNFYNYNRIYVVTCIVILGRIIVSYPTNLRGFTPYKMVTLPLLLAWIFYGFE